MLPYLLQIGRRDAAKNKFRHIFLQIGRRDAAKNKFCHLFYKQLAAEQRPICRKPSKDLIKAA